MLLFLNHSKETSVRYEKVRSRTKNFIFLLGYPYLIVKFFGVSLWLNSLKIKVKSLGLMKLQACNPFKDIFVTASKIFLKDFE